MPTGKRCFDKLTADIHRTATVTVSIYQTVQPTLPRCEHKADQCLANVIARLNPVEFWLQRASKARFPLAVLTARVDGCQKMHPSSRAVNSARELGP